MLTAFVFDLHKSEEVEDWAPALERLDHGNLLWLALHDPTEEDSLREMEPLRDRAAG